MSAHPENDRNADDFRRLRFAVSETALYLKLIRLHLWLKAGFNPDQPRVPAGNPNGGQWTDADGPYGRPLLRLEDEEANGGHAIRMHVGKSDQFLIRRIRTEQFPVRVAERLPRIGKPIRAITARRLFQASTFQSLEAANRLVRSTLSNNRRLVRTVASGEARGRVEVRSTFNRSVGRLAAARGLGRPRIRAARRVIVIIKHDPNIPRGYRVITAYVE